MYKWPFCNIMTIYCCPSATQVSTSREKKCIVFKWGPNLFKQRHIYSHSNHWMRYVQCWCWFRFCVTLTHTNTRAHLENKEMRRKTHIPTNIKTKPTSTSFNDLRWWNKNRVCPKSKLNLITHSKLSYFYTVFYVTIIEMEEVPTTKFQT